MVYNLHEAIAILSRTPKVLQALLEELPDSWINYQKHDDAFSPSEVIGHLIAGEQTDWIPRMQIMLSEAGSKEFPPFNREGFDQHLGLEERLAQFTALRAQNLKILKELVTVDDLHKTGIHPEFGEVTLQQHLATWVVHDLTHLFQIIETLALRYKESVGPWVQYLRILNV
ncbi:MAG: DinB family protein [Candidatus Heimdallarchaeota archaeon]|nr:MAG: DinB family protein [Candidatus Heimdallarchaeota archaeon]